MAKSPFQVMLGILADYDEEHVPTPQEWEQLYNQVLCTTCKYVGTYLKTGVKPTGFEHDIRAHLH